MYILTVVRGRPEPSPPALSLLLRPCAPMNCSIETGKKYSVTYNKKFGNI